MCRVMPIKVLMLPETNDKVPPDSPAPPARVSVGLPLVPIVLLVPVVRRTPPAATLIAVPARDPVPVKASAPLLMLVLPV